MDIHQASQETIDRLEAEIDRLNRQKIELRDLFAVAAMVAEFSSRRGISIDQAVDFSYQVADRMLEAREASNG